jgi:photosystem I P700 chlorophyll a apoprotein A1
MSDSDGDLSFRKIYPPKPGHFSRTLAKGPNTTTWIWNLHADAHDFDSHTSDLEDISRKVFSAHFGQLGVIFIWLSGCDTVYVM